MYFNRVKYNNIALAILFMMGSDTLLAASNPIHNANTSLKSTARMFNYLKQGHTQLQLGGYWGSQGKAQHINIDGLIGDDFTVSNSNNSNALVGLGYFIDGPVKPTFNLSYGLNFFYLPTTSVAGTVVQEGFFTNLSYRYNVTHYPLLAIAKSTIDLHSTRLALTVDAGIGPNFMATKGFQERSLDGITLPDSMFSGKTTTTFSATAGVGMKFNQVFGETPLECGYRFFYLGQGHFNVINSQVSTTLKTGNAYANAMVCSLTI